MVISLSEHKARYTIYEHARYNKQRKTLVLSRDYYYISEAFCSRKRFRNTRCIHRGITFNILNIEFRIRSQARVPPLARRSSLCTSYVFYIRHTYSPYIPSDVIRHNSAASHRLAAQNLLEVSNSTSINLPDEPFISTTRVRPCLTDVLSRRNDPRSFVDVQ